jgi:hypothetical protein
MKGFGHENKSTREKKLGQGGYIQENVLKVRNLIY